MADSLVLTGVKNVKKHTGTEMLLTRPKRGGDTHLVKEWWKNRGVSTCYADCTVFKVTSGGSSVNLVLDTSMGTNVRIDHDGAFNFTFYKPNELRRAALFTEDMQLIEHYVFPAISGGKIMTVTPANAASRPNTDGGDGGNPTGNTINVTIDSANGSSAYVLSGDVTGENATINLTAGDVLTITNNLNAHPLYIKTASTTGTSEQVTEGTVTGQGSTNGDIVWDTTGVTPGTYYYQCGSHLDMNGQIIVA